MIMTVYSLVPGAPLPEELEREDRPVYVPPDTGRDLPEALRTEPRLNGIPDSPGKTASFLTRLLWWMRFLLGIGSPAESARQVRHRARSFAEELLQRNEACVVAAEDSFLELFLRALRRKGFVVRRSSIGFVRPGEKIFLSQRQDHCGGCSHNCLLQNPGCGVGRDKARRGY